MQINNLQSRSGNINASPLIREILIFSIKLAFIYVIWRLFTIFIGAEAEPVELRPWPWLSVKWGIFNVLLKTALTWCSVKVLLLLGYNAYTLGKDLIEVSGYGGVGIGNYCLAIELMVLFTALIVSYPAPVIHKLWFIPLGLLVIQIVNVIRIASLCILAIHLPKYVDFNHHYTFRVIVFIFILLMYNWFINHYGNRLVKAPDPLKAQ